MPLALHVVRQMLLHLVRHLLSPPSHHSSNAASEFASVRESVGESTPEGSAAAAALVDEDLAISVPRLLCAERVLAADQLPTALVAWAAWLCSDATRRRHSNAT